MTNFPPSNAPDAASPAAGHPGPRRLLAAAVLVLTACAGGSLASVRTAPVPSVPDALRCAEEEGDAMGFDTVRRDEDEHRRVLERSDREVQQSDPKFQRAIDQLTLEEDRESSGGDLRIEVRTYYEYMTRRGRTRRQREVSAGASTAAQTLLEVCASGS